jgi:hypothetical protein
VSRRDTERFRRHSGGHRLVTTAAVSVLLRRALHSEIRCFTGGLGIAMMQKPRGEVAQTAKDAAQRWRIVTAKPAAVGKET